MSDGPSSPLPLSERVGHALSLAGNEQFADAILDLTADIAVGQYNPPSWWWQGMVGDALKADDAACRVNGFWGDGWAYPGAPLGGAVHALACVVAEVRYARMPVREMSPYPGIPEPELIRIAWSNARHDARRVVDYARGIGQ